MKQGMSDRMQEKMADRSQSIRQPEMRHGMPNKIPDGYQHMYEIEYQNRCHIRYIASQNVKLYSDRMPERMSDYKCQIEYVRKNVRIHARLNGRMPARGPNRMSEKIT